MSEDCVVHPRARTTEFGLFVEQIAKSSFSVELKKKKAVQIAKRYLFYCTLNYAFFISDVGQTAHYGIERRKLSRQEFAAIMKDFVNESYEILRSNGLDSNKAMFKNMMMSYFWAFTLVNQCGTSEEA